MSNVYKKCSFCKFKFNESILKEYRKNNYLSLGSIFVCKVCEKKIDIQEYQSKSLDNYVINSLRYKNKIKHGLISNDNLLEIQLLNIKLKRQIKNDKKS